MKKITTYTLIAVFSLVVVFNSNAQESILASKTNESSVHNIANHRINIRVNSSNQVILRADLFEGQKKLNYALKVYSESGDIVYTRNFLKKGAIYTSYDLSNLPEGKYTFSVLKKRVPLYSKIIINGSSHNTMPANGELVVEKL